MALIMQAKELESMVTSIDSNNMDLKNDIEICQTEFRMLEKYSKDKSLPSLPGQKI